MWNTSKLCYPALPVTQVAPASSIVMPDALHRFSGKVEEWDGMSKHLVAYDDGDEEWLDLAIEEIKLHAKSSETHIVFHKHTLPGYSIALVIHPSATVMLAIAHA